MVNEAEARNSADEAGGGQATVRAPSCSRDPLRSLMVLKWLTRLFVYAGVTALIPLDHALSGLTWQQAISVHLGGYVFPPFPTRGPKPTRAPRSAPSASPSPG